MLLIIMPDVLLDEYIKGVLELKWFVGMRVLCRETILSIYSSSYCF